MELVKKGLYVGYKFVCGLQTFCMWVTNVLYAGHKHFVCGSQTFCMRVTNVCIVVTIPCYDSYRPLYDG